VPHFTQVTNFLGVSSDLNVDANEATITPESIAARIESLPPSQWNLRIAVLLGAATFFDAFDALTVAFIMPSILLEWHLSTINAAWLVAAGYAGQALGAVIIGALAERYGRVPVLVGAIASLGVCSLICAAADNSLQLMLARFAQGIGLGGEVPVAAAYLSEMIRSDRRGKVFMLYQSTFGVGIVGASIVGSLVVPHFGWRAMFVVGCIPIALAFVIARICPESPRWLANKGKLLHADRIMRRIEEQVSKNHPRPHLPLQLQVSRDGPSKPLRQGWATLFSDIYLERTAAICCLWITAYACTYAITIWVPTLLTRVYGVGLQTALNLSIITNAAGSLGVCSLALFVDRVKRRSIFAGGFAATLFMLFSLAALRNPGLAVTIGGLALALFFLFILTSSLYLYTPELYPTRVRALGTGFASFCLRVTAVLTPFGMGVLVQRGKPALIYFVLGCIAGIGALICFFWSVETSGRKLEEVSP
jgi:MFS transporter, putative metabolite:H+ symporter